MKSLLTIFTLVFTLFVANTAFSADFQKGLTAYNSGDYATALREWTPLANQGNASSVQPGCDVCQRTRCSPDHKTMHGGTHLLPIRGMPMPSITWAWRTKPVEVFHRIMSMLI